MRFEKRIHALETAMLSNPVVLHFADGTIKILTGRRYFLVDLFARRSSGSQSD
jgi:hypothetical protein